MKNHFSAVKHFCLTLFSILFLLNFSTKIQAQEIQLETISISNGLASPQVMDVMQDSYGLIWLATGNGIQRYDGYTWKTIRNIIGNPNTLQNNITFDIEEDANHDLWIANDKGVTKYVRSKNTFINYDFEALLDLALGSGRVFNILADSQGRVWATTVAKEILQFNPATETWAMASYGELETPNTERNGISFPIIEDKNGGIWAGSSTHGLLHLPKGADSFTPIVFEGLVDFNSNTNSITALHFDKDGILWITSRLEIHKYNLATKELKMLAEYDYALEDIFNSLNSIQEDRDGNVWILNNFRGVLKFEGNTDRFEEVIIPGNRKINYGGWTIRFTHMLVDSSGIIWFGSLTDGLFKYDPINKPFKAYINQADDPNSISPGGVFGLFASKITPGKVYIGTRGHGINVFDNNDQSVKKVNFTSDNDMFGGSSRSIYEQKDGTIWIGTWGDGLIKMDQNYNEIKRYKNNPEDKNSLINDQVRVIREDRSGKLWIGTNGGLDVFDPKTETYTELVSQYAKSYSDEIILQVKTWLEEGKSLAIIEKVKANQELTKEVEITEKATYFLVTVGEGDLASMADFGWLNNPSGETIAGMQAFGDSYFAGGDPKNRMQITQLELSPGKYTLRYSSDDSHHYDSWNAPEPEFLPLYGVAIFKQENQAEKQAKVVNINEQNAEIIIQDPNISDIEIGEKYIWIASLNAGLTQIDPETNAVTYYTSDPLDPNTLSSIQVNDVFEDEDGLIWMATYGGINILDPNSGEITKYTEEDGLPTNFLETILPGENGEMWLSSRNGLIQMMRNESLNKVTFINYNEDDGIGGDIFLSLAAEKSSEGNFYFGGDHGLTTFSTVASNKVPPSVIISNLSISNRSVYDMGAESPLDQDLLSAKAITLRYDQNDLSFEFAALHYANPSKNQYAHMMEGLDDDWVYDNRNFASYTNLEPGTYTFKVIASNAYGVWNEEGTSMIVTILPPWWRTWWAYTAYALFIGLIVYTGYSGLKRRIRMMERSQNLEREVAQSKEIQKAYKELKATQSQLIQSEKMASLGELTAGIAHEIQNPLNFVNNFSEVSTELIDELEEERAKTPESRDEGMVSEILADLKENLLKINHHGKRADSIVKGMLEHSRTNSRDVQPTNLNALADEFLRLSYHGLRAKDKSFSSDFATDLDPNLPLIDAVSQDIGRVILNLINNAFFAVDSKTKELKAKNGELGDYKPKVIVHSRLVDLAGDMGGVEISVEDNGNGIPKAIKDKIFQPFFTTKPAGSGTGLGLSLSYDIIRAHGGDLRVKSKEGVGTEMIFFLPIKEE
jgi:signal transduction histidine kinase/ligand-binding sensor domain-containing protein